MKPVFLAFFILGSVYIASAQRKEKKEPPKVVAVKKQAPKPVNVKQPPKVVAVKYSRPIFIRKVEVRKSPVRTKKPPKVVARKFSKPKFISRKRS
jgi:hypothetical protein